MKIKSMTDELLDGASKESGNTIHIKFVGGVIQKVIVHTNIDGVSGKPYGDIKGVFFNDENVSREVLKETGVMANPLQWKSSAEHRYVPDCTNLQAFFDYLNKHPTNSTALHELKKSLGTNGHKVELHSTDDHHDVQQEGPIVTF